MELTKDDLKLNNSYISIIKLALPISISILIPQISFIINTIFLGKYNTSNSPFKTQDLLTISGISGVYYLVLIMICYGLSTGILMLMSRKAGENDSVGIGKIFSNGIMLGVLLSSILVLLSYLLIPFFSSFYLHETLIQKGCQSFINIRVFGLPFIVICQISNSLFIATSNPKPIVISTCIQTSFNIILDYFLIFGNWGFPEMGLLGAAYSAVISEIIYFLSILLIIKYYSSLSCFKGYLLNSFNWDLVKEILKKSTPLMFQFFLSIGAWEVFFVFVEHLGTKESAISQIHRSIFGVISIVAWTFASTCSTMVSNLIGQGKLNEVIPINIKIIKLSFGITFLIGMIIFLFPEFTLKLLTNNDVIIREGIESLRVVIIACCMFSVSVILFNGVIGTGNTKVNLIFEIIAIIIYLTYCYIIIEKMKLSLTYAWIAEILYWFILFLFSFIYLYSQKWKISLNQSN